MKKSKADYLFVAGHYPVYSGCEHGDTFLLKEFLKPKLEKYGAHYISGHDHCQFYINDGKGVGYFLSGTG